jgi:hypothetical protein
VRLVPQAIEGLLGRRAVVAQAVGLDDQLELVRLVHAALDLQRREARRQIDQRPDRGRHANALVCGDVRRENGCDEEAPAGELGFHPL